jgi:hypothetical protein
VVVPLVHFGPLLGRPQPRARDRRRPPACAVGARAMGCRRLRSSKPAGTRPVHGRYTIQPVYYTAGTRPLCSRYAAGAYPETRPLQSVYDTVRNHHTANAGRIVPGRPTCAVGRPPLARSTTGARAPSPANDAANTAARALRPQLDSMFARVARVRRARMRACLRPPARPSGAWLPALQAAAAAARRRARVAGRRHRGCGSSRASSRRTRPSPADACACPFVGARVLGW